MPARPPAPTPPPRNAPTPLRHAAGFLVALVLLGRAVLQIAPPLAVFIVVTALAGAVVEDPKARLGVGAAAVLLPALILHFRIAHLLRTRTRFAPPDFAWTLAAVNAAVAITIALGFADDTGRALRRRGDWFVGERNGLVSRLYRAGLGAAAGYLEKFDPPPELAAIVLPPDPNDIPEGPYLPGQEPPPPPPRIIGWYHPLLGPKRQMPLTESRRFGAARPQPRPSECELGHCGVDLGGAIGEPVFAVFDGVVERVERDEDKGGRAGRYIRIGHKEGAVVSRYIHLDSIRTDLREGMTVKGGELIGRLGTSGIHSSGPHLHFGLSLRKGGSERYIDPEPLLRGWQLPSLPPNTQMARADSANRVN